MNIYKFMTKNILIFVTILFFILSSFVFYSSYSLAEIKPQTVTEPETTPSEPVSLPNPLNPTCEGATCKNPTPQVLIGTIINQVLGVVGSLALLMFIYGGFTWMLAGGNAEAVTKGKNILIWATIGLIVIFSAYALVKFVFGGLGV